MKPENDRTHRIGPMTLGRTWSKRQKRRAE